MGERGLRILVCGGREYGYMRRGIRPMSLAWMHERDRVQAERDLVNSTLDRLRPEILIHGAARGADERASLWAEKNGIKQIAYPADWYPNGRRGGLNKAAGPARNQKMIDEGKPDLVVAFPGGRGTADMVHRAKSAGIEVIEIG